MDKDEYYDFNSGRLNGMDGFKIMLAAMIFISIMVPACADMPKGERSLEVEKGGDSLKFKSDTRESADSEKPE